MIFLCFQGKVEFLTVLEKKVEKCRKHIQDFFQLGVVVMFLSVTHSLIYLLVEGLYQDTNFYIVKGWWIGDLVTLFVTVLSFLLAIVLCKRGANTGFA